MKEKMIKVDEDVHQKAKLDALKKNMSLKDYVRKLVFQDINTPVIKV